MSQIALNTVALFIFSITCLILFGPLIHLPAGVPVVLVLAALTIGTADTFGLQGRGANLFLDWFAQRSPDYRNRIVHHEAGHFLVAHLLGVPITGYTLTAMEAIREGYPGIGGVQFSSVTLSADALEQVKDYCAISMAGRAAEKLMFETVEGGRDDLAWLRNQTQSLNLNPQLYEQDASLKANRLLKENWDAYQKLVESMKNRDSVEACCMAIAAASSPPQPTSGTGVL